MNNLRNFNELNRETYLSAANKLSNIGHKKRSDKLIKHSNRNIFLNEIDSHPFNINGEEYKITSAEIDEYKRTNIEMKSTSDTIQLRYDVEDGKLIITTPDKYSKINRFKFSNRKDARYFLNFINNKFKFKNYNNLNINKIYN